jgi:hypothetical protein
MRVKRKRSANMKTVIVGTLALLSAGIALAPASAGPLSPAFVSGLPEQQPTVIQVRHRKHWSGHRHWGHGDDWDGWGVPLGLGLGMALTAPLYADRYYGYGGYAGAHLDYCLNRYRSYDPETNTFRGYDGLLHECISPYM